MHPEAASRTISEQVILQSGFGVFLTCNIARRKLSLLRDPFGRILSIGGNKFFIISHYPMISPPVPQMLRINVVAHRWDLVHLLMQCGGAHETPLPSPKVCLLRINSGCRGTQNNQQRSFQTVWMELMSPLLVLQFVMVHSYCMNGMCLLWTECL